MVNIKFKRTRLLTDVEWAITLGTWSNLYERMVSLVKYYDKLDDYTDLDNAITTCPSDHIGDNVITILSTMDDEVHTFNNWNAETAEEMNEDGLYGDYIKHDGDVLSYNYESNSDKTTLGALTMVLLIQTLHDKIPDAFEIEEIGVDEDSLDFDFDKLRREMAGVI